MALLNPTYYFTFKAGQLFLPKLDKLPKVVMHDPEYFPVPKLAVIVEINKNLKELVMDMKMLIKITIDIVYYP